MASDILAGERSSAAHGNAGYNQGVFSGVLTMKSFDDRK